MSNTLLQTDQPTELLDLLIPAECVRVSEGHRRTLLLKHDDKLDIVAGERNGVVTLYFVVFRENGGRPAGDRSYALQFFASGKGYNQAIKHALAKDTPFPPATGPRPSP